ncbi:uncharacterized protein LOC129947313 [Eupeodes corollae]|uniref:uncharacterized protein LOC129947313 n=1 Tax=Eupeodes corollae TaxID=290404 RepID=UPI002492EF54|nr:uncharacterized protein LOC129947313 [Eupeodes corollae]
MDPTKRIGKIKEQVELENISRRRYLEKWGKLTGKDVNRFYNQDEVNKILRNTNDRNVNKDIWPSSYIYTGHGDSYFVSKDMFESLVAKCRCGRRRTEGHSIKCLQKVQSKYFNDDGDGEGGISGNGNSSSKSRNDDIGRALPLPSSSSSLIASGDNGPSKRIQVKYDKDDSETEAIDTNGGGCGGSVVIRSQNHHAADGNGHKRIPETSNGVIGWPQSRFRDWEQSTKYVSPVTKMYGYKVTERPYNVIFIG